jgi:hypothetical protein
MFQRQLKEEEEEEVDKHVHKCHELELSIFDKTELTDIIGLVPGHHARKELIYRQLHVHASTSTNFWPLHAPHGRVRVMGRVAMFCPFLLVGIVLGCTHKLSSFWISANSVLVFTPSQQSPSMCTLSACWTKRANLSF